MSYYFKIIMPLFICASIYLRDDLFDSTNVLKFVSLGPK